MKKHVWKIFILALLLSFFSVTQVIAGRKDENPSSIAALMSGNNTSSPTAPLDVSMITTDFEASEGAPPGFAPGYCAQNGWTAFAASTVEGQVSNANPSSGAQHLRVSYDPAVAVGTNVGCFSPDIGAQTVEPMWMEVDVAVSGTGGADYQVVAQSPNQGFLTAWVNFEYQGNIWLLDDTGSGATWVDTGTAWNVGPYTTLRIMVNPGANTIEYSYGGSLIYTGVVFAGTTIEQVILFDDNWNITDVGDFDNLRVYRGLYPTSVSLVDFYGVQENALLPVVLAGMLILSSTGVLVLRHRNRHTEI